MAGDSETPKEGRFTHSKILKADSIAEARDLLRKLEAMARAIHNMTDEEIEKLWPQASSTITPKSVKKTEKQFLISLLAQAQNSIATSNLFKKHNIDINDERTRELLKKQSEELNRAH
jgi:hypothetical protein